MNIRVSRFTQLALGLLCMVMAIACSQHSGKSGLAGKDAFSYPFIQQFLSHQIDSLAASGQSLTYVDTHHGKQDSSMAKASTVRNILGSFLQASESTQDWAPEAYRKAQFTDSVHHLKIISYEAIHDSAKLNRVDLSLDSSTGGIKQIYIQQIVSIQDSTIREQLIWKADQSISLITMVDKHEYTSDIRKQQFIWDQPKP